MKKIDLSNQEGLNELKEKAKYYGHYAEALQVLELINIIEASRADPELAAHEAARKFAEEMNWTTPQIDAVTGIRRESEK